MSTYNYLKDQFISPNPPRNLFPLLWLNGDERETEEVLRREIADMDEGGCGGFIIESRPHNDYLGDRWWQDVDVCMSEAIRRNMEVWLFDEEYYPSGIAGGKVLAENPDYRMQVLVKEASRWNIGMNPFRDEDHPSDWECLLKIVCFPVNGISVDANNRIHFNDRDALEHWQRSQMQIDANQIHTWEIVLIGLKKSWSGRMTEKMVDYLCPEITDRFIAITYEATKAKYGHLFGSTIQGFFGDETSFENFASYDVLFGEDTPSMPWTRVLLDSFKQEKGYDLISSIESLWYDGIEGAEKVRYDFMDQMTRLFSANFFGRIQAWCHANKVKFIGHVVEDNRAHMHHGYGPGHFFRTTRHFDMGGYDFVLRQIDSEQKQTPYLEHFPQFKGYRDEPMPDFFHYTLAKLAQSAAHLEIQTDLVMCENFGAYGWDLGLREMKWLTDWQTSRGTNWYVPHAFSPLFPDPDCSPHFYADGKNPQWPFFRQWANYANRSCLMLQQADHVTSIAVLYPAESHWAGDIDLLDPTCKALMQHQYDFDIVSCDLLSDKARCRIQQGTIEIGKEKFHTVILAGIQTIPLLTLERLQEFVHSGGKLIAIRDKLHKDCGGNHTAVVSIMKELGDNAPVIALSELDSFLRQTGQHQIKTNKHYPDLRMCHFRKGELDIFFLNNESVHDTVEDLITFKVEGTPEFWHPMNGQTQAAVIYDYSDGQPIIPIRLEPYESIFVVFQTNVPIEQQLLLSELNLTDQQLFSADIDLQGNLAIYNYSENNSTAITNWTVTSIRSPLTEATNEGTEPITGLGNWLEHSDWSVFTGTMVYESVVSTLLLGNYSFILDLGQVGEIASVWLNGTQLETLLCPPYRIKLPAELLVPENIIRVEVTNTLGAFLREDGFQRNRPEPSGLLGPVKLNCYVTYTLPLYL